MIAPFNSQLRKRPVDTMKRWIPWCVLAVAAIAMIVNGPIAQLAHYHEFADSRSLWSIPNAGDVLSNFGFAVVGIWGFADLAPKRRDPRLVAGWEGYAVFLGAVILTALGSSFYHLAPDNGRLLWDRLPIALACAGLLAATHAETHASSPRALLPALVVAAIASVAWWSITDARGMGDLRPYLFMQAAPLVVIPLWQWIAGAPRADRIAFGIAIGLYALAKVFELEDHALFNTLGIVSGHTLKHLLAAAAAAVLTGNLVRRTSRRQIGG